MCCGQIKNPLINKQVIHKFVQPWKEIQSPNLCMCDHTNGLISILSILFPHYEAIHKLSISNNTACLSENFSHKQHPLNIHPQLASFHLKLLAKQKLMFNMLITVAAGLNDPTAYILKRQYIL